MSIALETDQYQELILKQKKFYALDMTKRVEYRLAVLKLLKESIKKHEDLINQALLDELGKGAFDSYSTEIGLVYDEISHAIKKLKKWSKPKRVKTPMTNMPGSSKVYRVPYGQTLIIAPWNYPFSLAMVPLVSAIAAGNTVILKPSEYTPKVSNAIKTLIEDVFNEEYIKVVLAGVDGTTQLLKNKFDMIFFTGSTAVGKIVHKAAAEHLTPTVLELGGKSPAIVDQTAKIKNAALKIAWGKFLNAGQTCVAPDYVLVHSDVKDSFISEMKNAIQDFYNGSPRESDRFIKIINDKHHNRLASYLNDGNILYGGDHDIEDLYMSPTLIEPESFDTPVMQDEIFGPILPIISYSDDEELYEMIDKNPDPLAAYLFSEDKAVQRDFSENLNFGGGCINTTVLHVASSHMPFGGVGTSGMGNYHGENGFNTFTREKSILKQSTKIDPGLIYPHKKTLDLKLIKKIMK